MIERIKSMKFKVETGDATYYAKFEQDNYGWITVKLYNYEWFGKQINKGCEHLAYYLNGRETLIRDALWKYETYKNKVGA